MIANANAIGQVVLAVGTALVEARAPSQLIRREVRSGVLRLASLTASLIWYGMRVCVYYCVARSVAFVVLLNAALRL